MLDSELCINIGNAKAIYYRQPKYAVHESKIMSKLISELENNNWIRDYAGPRGALLLLAAKPHQESCIDVDKFVWRMCVSYIPLNIITRSLEFPIPRCFDSIEDLGDSYRKLFFISFDVRSDYHQVPVREYDQEKLSFFTYEGKRFFLLLYLLNLRIHLPFTPP